MSDDETTTENLMILGEQLTRAELEVRMDAARRYPRSITFFQEDLSAAVSKSEAVADSMFYGIEREGEWIEGPSVRFSEMVAHFWGNIMSDGRFVETGDSLVAQGAVWDLERNVGARVEIQRSVLDHRGQKLGQDFVLAMGNAAVAVATRNAIFDVVPASFTTPALDLAMATAMGSNKTMDERRDQWLEFFISRGVDEDAIYRKFGIGGKTDIGVREIRRMMGLRTAIDEGSTDLETAFARSMATATLDDLNTALGQGDKTGAVSDDDGPGAQEGGDTQDGTAGDEGGTLSSESVVAQMSNSDVYDRILELAAALKEAGDKIPRGWKGQARALLKDEDRKNLLATLSTFDERLRHITADETEEGVVE